jgi:hypothetical protein
MSRVASSLLDGDPTLLTTAVTAVAASKRWSTTSRSPDDENFIRGFGGMGAPPELTSVFPRGTSVMPPGHLGPSRLARLCDGNAILWMRRPTAGPTLAPGG